MGSGVLTCFEVSDIFKSWVVIVYRGLGRNVHSRALMDVFRSFLGGIDTKPVPYRSRSS